MIIGIASADYMRSDRTPSGKDAWGGSGFARVGQYLPHIKAAGHTVITGTLWLEGDCLSIEDGYLNKQFPDIIISQRLMMDNLVTAYKIGRSAGQIIVNDVDDWYWGLSTTNEAFKHSHPKHNAYENTNYYRQSLAASSYVTVSTPYLHGRLSRTLKVPMTILPNYVDVSRFSPVTITDTDCPDVGWAGSTSHRSGDIEILNGVLGPLAKEGSIKLVHAGDCVGSPSFASQLGVEEDLISRKIPRALAEDYPSILDFEVGLIPLRNTPFNEAKSDIKGLEYAAAGIPFVASNLPSYVGLANSGFDGGSFLAKNGEQWKKYVTRFRSPELRKHCQDHLLEVVKERDIAVGAKNLIDYLESLVPR